jgi:hypothetical protein
VNVSTARERGYMAVDEAFSLEDSMFENMVPLPWIVGETSVPGAAGLLSSTFRGGSSTLLAFGSLVLTI